MRAFSVFSASLLFVATALGISVTSPVEGASWDASKSTQSVAWDFVSTDTPSLSISLVNMVVNPSVNIVLKEDVTTSSGSATVNAPSSGWPTGKGYQINLIQKNNNAILAQSQQFNITGTTTPLSSSVSSSRSSSRSSTAYPQNTAGGDLPSSSTDSSLPSQTGNSQGNTGGAMGLAVQMSYVVGFALVGALLA